MPPTSWTSSPIYQFLFLSIFILAFFPSAFLYLFQLPLHPFRPTAPLHPSSPPPCPPHCLAPAAEKKMSWTQKTFSLPPRSRGSYLITSHVVAALPEIASYRVGLLHLFVQHTSCALSMNENWDEEVREDMSDALDRIVPEEGQQLHSMGGSAAAGKLYRHSAEGKDDMPAHVKSALIGSSVTIPISNGELATGTWQGIWYLEFRARKHTRSVVATIQGEKLQ